MADRYPLIPHRARGIFPGNIQNIGITFTCYDFKSVHLIVIGSSRPPINPGCVGQHGLLSWLHSLYWVESNVSL